MNKSTWLWDISLAMAGYSARDEYLKFCKANRVNKIYLWWPLAPNFAQYKSFVYDMGRNGIEVYACIGSAYMYDPDNYSQIQARLNAIQSYQDSGNVDTMFKGIMFDIEPHTLDEWKDGNGDTRLDMIGQWLEVMDRYNGFVKRNLGLSVGMAAPLLLGKEEYSDYLPSILCYHDEIVVMAYRNTASGNDSIMDHALPFLRVAEYLLLPESVVIGVETKDVQPTKTTFFSAGRRILEMELKTVDFWARDYKSYKGVSIHALNYWMDLPYDSLYTSL